MKLQNPLKPSRNPKTRRAATGVPGVEARPSFQSVHDSGGSLTLDPRHASGTFSSLEEAQDRAKRGILNGRPRCTGLLHADERMCALRHVWRNVSGRGTPQMRNVSTWPCRNTRSPALNHACPGSTTMSIASNRSSATLLISPPNGFSMTSRRLVSRYCQHHGIANADQDARKPRQPHQKIQRHHDRDRRQRNQPAHRDRHAEHAEAKVNRKQPSPKPAKPVADSDGHTAITVTSFN